MEKTFARTMSIVVVVSLILSIGLVIALRAYLSDLQTERGTEKTQIEQSRGLEALDVDDVKSIVVDVAMDLYQDGMMPEPTELHAEEACKLWNTHGASKASSYWSDRIIEAEDMNLNNVIPVLVIMRILVNLNEEFETSEPAITQYCNNVLRTGLNDQQNIDLSHLPEPRIERFTKYQEAQTDLPSRNEPSIRRPQNAGEESSIHQLMARRQSFSGPGSERVSLLQLMQQGHSFAVPTPVVEIEIEVKGDASKIEQYLVEWNYSDEVIAKACSSELVPANLDGWDKIMLDRWHRWRYDVDQNVKRAYKMRSNMVNALDEGHISNEDIRSFCAGVLSK